MTNTERNAEIVRRRNAGEWPTEIAKALGISRNTVIGVCFRAGLSDRETGRRMVLRGENNPCAKLSAADVAAIRREYIPRKRGHTVKDLARRFNVSISTVEKIVYRRAWNEAA